jgi:UDP-glucose 4-epimerase
MNVLLIGATGYIGSALYGHLVDAGKKVIAVDDGRRGNPGNILCWHVGYGDLHPEWIEQTDVIVLLAGHSSVGACADDPRGAFQNNVVAFERLLNLIDGQRLIYASSSSVYSGFGAEGASESPPVGGNIYDLTKLTIDGLATLSGKDCYGLRFGTVNGPSANTRWDLMLNKMVKSARDDGHITVANPEVHRPILAIKDLCRAVLAIIDGEPAPGIYNLCSFNATVLEMATRASEFMGVPYVTAPPSLTYDFAIRTSKFYSQYGVHLDQGIDDILRDLEEAL